MIIKKRLHATIEPLSRRLSAIVHPHSLSILLLLGSSDMRERELAQQLGIAENLVAHHLKKLFNAGLIEKFRVGAKIFYRINIPGMQKFLRDLRDVLETH